MNDIEKQLHGMEVGDRKIIYRDGGAAMVFKALCVPDGWIIDRVYVPRPESRREESDGDQPDYTYELPSDSLASVYLKYRYGTRCLTRPRVEMTPKEDIQVSPNEPDNILCRSLKFHPSERWMVGDRTTIEGVDYYIELVDSEPPYPVDVDSYTSIADIEHVLYDHFLLDGDVMHLKPVES